MRRSINKYLFVTQIAVFVLACMAFIFHPDEELDLYRYYENANMLSVNMSAWDYIRRQFFTEGDFFYGLSFLFVKKVGLPIAIVNFFFVGLYYWLIYKILLYYSLTRSVVCNSSWLFVYVVIFTFFVAQPILVFSISRQVSAICMFYVGILYYLKGRPKICVCFIILSMLFHVGMFMFVVFLIIAYSLCKFHVYRLFRKKTVVLLLLVGLLVSMVDLSKVMGVVDNFAVFFSERYQKTYLNMEGNTDIDLSLDMKIQMFLLLLNLSILKNNNLLFSIGLVIYLALCFFSTNVFFLLQRVFLFFPVFQGIMTLKCLRGCRSAEKANFYLILMFMASSFSILTIYLYRRCFF